MQSTSKIIFFLVLALLVVGTGVWAWSSLQTPTPSTSQPIGTGTSGVQTTIVTPVRTSTQEASTTSGTMSSSVSILNSAKVISFTPTYAVSTSSAGAVYALYKDDIATSKSLYPAETKFLIDTATVDLNQDGTPEVLVYENLPGFCGSAGCNLAVYQLGQTGWTKIADTFGGEDVRLTDRVTQGYFDLLFSVTNDIGSQVNVTQFAWDGGQYKPGRVLGVWSGGSFTAQ